MFRGLLLALAMLSTQVQAQALSGYEQTGRPAVEREDGKIEIVEYFWFGCPHCYALEPHMKAWLKTKPDYVEFRREAPPFNQGWVAHAQAFYAAEKMGVNDIFFDALFDAIHKDKRRLNSVESISEFAGELGIDEELFAKTMKSFAVRGDMQKAAKSAVEYGLRGVPAIIINGQYRTSGSIAGSYNELINVMNAVAEREYKAANTATN